MQTQQIKFDQHIYSAIRHALFDRIDGIDNVTRLYRLQADYPHEFSVAQTDIYFELNNY